MEVGLSSLRICRHRRDLRTRGAVAPMQTKDHRLQFIGGKGMCRETRGGIGNVSANM